MAWKQRRDGKLWKDIFNCNFIVIISGLLYLMLFVTCEPVCYTKISLDERNRHIKKVNCDGTDEICWRFASRKDVKMGDLLNSRCSYPEAYPVTRGKYPKAITCSTTTLPTVTNGSFDCGNKSDVAKGNACNLTCNDGFYPANSNQTVCEGGTSNGGGEWSEGRSFDCRAITCSITNLPIVSEGSFDCGNKSEVAKGDACNLACDDGFYPANSNQTVCEAGTSDGGAEWSEGRSFECHAITCSTTSLPTVTKGSFECAPNSDMAKGDTCNLICDDGFYPANSTQTVCEAGTSDRKGEWSKGQSFECPAITCQNIHLPTVNAGFFNCSGNSVGDKCNLICDDGFYPCWSKETVCEAHGGRKANWTVGHFQCTATCLTANLPTVTEGSFDCAPNSDEPQCEPCTLHCNDGFYPSYSDRAVCETTNQGRVWSNGIFECRRFDCNKWNRRNGSEYKIINTWRNWEESRQVCESSNSHLVTIENKVENEFVRKMVLHCEGPYTAAWIGLNDIDAEGTWKWSDGTVSTYRNWRAHNQKYGDEVEDCAYVHGDKGGWFDTKCTLDNRFVCERNNNLT